MATLSTLNGILFHWLGAGYAPEAHLLAVGRWLAVPGDNGNSKPRVV